MTDRVTFFYNPMSRGRIVHWMLEEVGATYDVELLKWDSNDQKSPSYLKINPMGKIPAIVHRDVVVTECAAICAYLADAFPNSELAPALDDPNRGSYYRWLFFAASCIEPAMLEKTHPSENKATPSMLGYGSYEDVVKTIEQAIANGFLVGDKFSAADLFLSANLEWYILNKVIPQKAIFTDYIKSCQNRPGHQRFLEKVSTY